MRTVDAPTKLRLGSTRLIFIGVTPLATGETTGIGAAV